MHHRHWSNRVRWLGRLRLVVRVVLPEVLRWIFRGGRLWIVSDGSAGRLPATVWAQIGVEPTKKD